LPIAKLLDLEKTEAREEGRRMVETFRKKKNHSASSLWSGIEPLGPLLQHLVGVLNKFPAKRKEGDLGKIHSLLEEVKLSFLQCGNQIL